MGSKSAAKYKLAKDGAEMTDEEKLQVLDDMVDKFKSATAHNIEILIAQCTRFDNLLAIHDSFARFEGGDMITIEEAKEIASKMVDKMKTAKNIVSLVETSDFLDREASNPMDALIPSEEPETWHDAIVQAIMFSAIRPFGEQIDNMIGQIRQKANEIGYDCDGSDDE